MLPHLTATVAKMNRLRTMNSGTRTILNQANKNKLRTTEYRKDLLSKLKKAKSGVERKKVYLGNS